MFLPASLARSTPGDLLGQLHRAGASGILELVDDRPNMAGRRHRIVLRAGCVTDVQSPEPVPPLGEILLSRGAITPTQHLKLLSCVRGKLSTNPTGRILRDRDDLPIDKLREALRLQIRLRLDAICSIDRGFVRFHVQNEAPAVGESELPVLTPSEFLFGRPRTRDRAHAGPFLHSQGRRESQVVTNNPKAIDHMRACEILGVSDKATIREIRVAFRKKAAGAHPDACVGLSSQDREKSGRWFALLSRAYHKLLETNE